MHDYAVQFRCGYPSKDPTRITLQYTNPDGKPNPETVIFPNEIEFHSAFAKAGIFLHGSGDHTRPEPDKHYQVTDEALRDLGFTLGNRS
jgi:hypothetical protein